MEKIIAQEAEADKVAKNKWGDTYFQKISSYPPLGSEARNLEHLLSDNSASMMTSAFQHLFNRYQNDNHKLSKTQRENLATIKTLLCDDGPDWVIRISRWETFTAPLKRSPAPRQLQGRGPWPFERSLVFTIIDPKHLPEGKSSSSNRTGKTAAASTSSAKGGAR
jgi:hypothetical protein